MNYRMLFLPFLLLSAPAFAADITPCAEDRIEMTAGLEALYKDACAHACKDGGSSIEDCTAFATKLVAMSLEEDDEEFAMCKEQGGLLVARMPACSEAFASLFNLNKDNTLGESLELLFNVGERCSGAALCDAQTGTAKDTDAQ